ncbi:MAG: hypothetical protein H7276_09710 [Caulobacter sp.]|nr:hypothetical protein [Vitreoscilla sp.]
MDLDLLEGLFFKWAGLLVLIVVGALVLRARTRQQTPSNVPPPPDAAWLVLMRDGLISDNMSLRADVDGERVAVLKSRRHAVIALRPGTHVLNTNVLHALVRAADVSFDVVPGEVVVYRLRPPFLKRPGAERVTDVAAARATIATLKSATPGVLLPDVRTDVTSS